MTNHATMRMRLETKQQSTMWAFEGEPNPTKVVCGKSTPKQMVVCFFGKTDHVACNVARSIVSGTLQFLWRTPKKQIKAGIIIHNGNASSHIDSNQRLFDRPKCRIDGSTTAQPRLDSQ